MFINCRNFCLKYNLHYILNIIYIHIHLYRFVKAAPLKSDEIYAMMMMK